MVTRRQPFEIDATSEIRSIVSFIQRLASDDSKLVLGVSGGLDSDVVARLCTHALGADRVRLFIVLQTDMEERHVMNARVLSQDLAVPLVELDLACFPVQMLEVLSATEPKERFSTASLLDVGKAKNSLRTWVYSMYAERGYIVVGSSNCTEIETGFYLPFGDGMSHIMPIAHLYKTQVRFLAQTLGTRPEVIAQQPSAGYWIGETDLDDLAYWLFHGAPILEELHLNAEEQTLVHAIRAELTFEAIDMGLYAIAQRHGVETVARQSRLSLRNAERLMLLVRNVPIVKGRMLRAHL